MQITQILQILIVKKLDSFNFCLGSCKTSNLSQPGLNGALFVNFSGGLFDVAQNKPWEICKKAGVEDGICRPKKNKNKL